MNTARTIQNYKPPTGRIARLVLNPLSRIIHGNAAGYANNAVGRRILHDCQRRAAAQATFADDPRARQLTERGYVALEPAYDRRLLESIRAQASTAFEDPRAFTTVGRHAVKPQRILRHPERLIPELAELLVPDVVAIIESHLRSFFDVEIIRLWRNYPVTGDAANVDHYSNLWHNDYDLVTRLRFFVLLTDGVTPETGAMRVLPISQTKRAMRRGYVRRDAIYGSARAVVDDVSSATFFTGNLGSAFIMNPQLCLHRASVPREGSFRDMVQFTLVPSDSPRRATWADDLPDDPEIPS
ncbi:MAG TPA: hypothetical protein VFA59_01255 [Vicinamibacterales bacterium]|nr:hypothetical protein [Vicinamibacterales bacterium]